jgi:CRP-like cAMP-binding protein
MEINDLQLAQRRIHYGKGDVIIEAGEFDETLFFLTSGHIGINCLSGGDERFLKRVKPGEILGGAQFFAASAWTFSLRALTEVQLHLLDRRAFLRLSRKFAGLEQKLQNHCASYDRAIADLLRSSGEDRREFPRYKACLTVVNRLQDPYNDKDSRDFNGMLNDVSRNGLSFQVRISSREHARLLLGREITSFIQAGGKTIAECSGMVIGARQQDAADQKFSIHVKFAGKLDETTLQRIVSFGE